MVGAGPSGVYAAEALTREPDLDVSVAVLDRLPVPFGLVRYGVAPDHPSIRSIRTTLERTLDAPGVTFYGDVQVGRDLTVEELRASVDAVVYAYGAGSDRRLGIPGEDLPGSHAATKASAALISRFTQSGRPLRKTATTGMPSALSRLSSARSVSLPGL